MVADEIGNSAKAIARTTAGDYQDASKVAADLRRPRT
jgi:hypothetical protein